MDTSSMPTVEDLRLISRYAFDEIRGARPSTGRGSFNDLAFALRELKLLGAERVYKEELRRHELLLRGFAPGNLNSSPFVPIGRPRNRNKEKNAADSGGSSNNQLGEIMCAENICFWKHPIVWMKVR